MKLISCVLVVWLCFHSYHEIRGVSGRVDTIQNGDPEVPVFFAGRGRRSGEPGPSLYDDRLRLVLRNTDKDTAQSISVNDVRNFLGMESKSEMEAKMRLPWSVKLPLDLSQTPLNPGKIKVQSPSRNELSALDEPTAFYIWYNIRKKQSMKPDPDNTPFMAARG